MAGTFDLMASHTVTSGSGDAAINFTGIGATHDDLYVLLECYGTSAANLKVNCNSNTSNVWSGFGRQFSASATNSYFENTSSAAKTHIELGYILNVQSNMTLVEMYFTGYRNTAVQNVPMINYRSISATQVVRIGDAFAAFGAGTSSNATAISAINLSLTTGNFAQNSRCSLYGISNTI